METFSASLAPCAGNSPVTGEIPSHRPETRSFDDLFDLRLNQQLSKQWRRRWFEMLPRSLWRQCNDMPFNGDISTISAKFVGAGWGIYASANCIHIGLDNGLSPKREQATIQTMLAYCPLDLLEQTSNKFQLIATNFHWRKRIWKCRLQNLSQIVLSPVLLLWWRCVITIRRQLTRQAEGNWLVAPDFPRTT